MFQLDVVNVSDRSSSVASPMPGFVRSTCTSPAGLELRTTVNVSVVPVSETTVDPLVCVTVNPGLV